MSNPCQTHNSGEDCKLLCAGKANQSNGTNHEK